MSGGLRLLPSPPARPERVQGDSVWALYTPAERARHDLPVEQWFELPQTVVVDDPDAIFGRRLLCPACGGGHWGAVNPSGYLLVYRCNDELGVGCAARFRGVDGETHVDGQVAAEIVCAFFGAGTWFWARRA